MFLNDFLIQLEKARNLLIDHTDRESYCVRGHKNKRLAGETGTECKGECRKLCKYMNILGLILL